MLTQKQETFCLKYFELGNATKAALIAGYNPRTARRIASENLTKPDIRERMTELNKPVMDSTIATVKERQERLSVFVREDINGQHGVVRHSNIQAVAELNKMGGDYAPEKHRIELDLPVNIIYKLKEVEAIE